MANCIVSEYDKRQVALFSVLGKVSSALFNQNTISEITVECPRVCWSTRYNAELIRGNVTSDFKEFQLRAGLSME